MGKKIRNVPWAEIKAAYLKGEGSMRELAERFKSTGVTLTAIEEKARRQKWTKEVTTLHGKVTEQVEKEVVKSMADLVKELMLKRYPPELWVKQLSTVAGFDLADVFEVDKDTHETKLRSDWCKKAKGAMQSVKIKTLTTEEGMVIQQVDLKPHDAMAAHQRIGQLLGFEADKDAKQATGVTINVTLPDYGCIFPLEEKQERIVSDIKEDKNE